MKILQTPVRFHPAVGGVEKYVLSLSKELVARGHQVTVLCADDPKSSLNQVQGVRVVRLPFIGKIANTNITPTLLFRLLRQDFDVVHTHMPTPWSAELSVLAAKLKGKPCVITYHNDVTKTGLLGLFTRIYNATLLRLVLGSVDRILVTQPRYIEDSFMLAGYRSKVSVLPNGVPQLPAISESPRLAQTILFVGILDLYHRYKGLPSLIRALALLKEDYPAVELEVVGAGELADEYKTLARQLGVDEHVTFRGYVDDQTLDNLYQTSGVFVLPSIDSHEGFGIVLLEAMSHEMPVVTTTVVGLSEEISARQAGLIVPPDDPHALADAVRQILDSPRLAREMGASGRGLVGEKYLWSNIAETAERLFRDELGA